MQKMDYEKLDMKGWGSKPSRIARHRNRLVDRRPVKNAGSDDSIERVKYMEAYLSKDKKFVPYEKRAAYEDQLRKRQQKTQETTEHLKPILIIAVIVIAILGFLYYTGNLGA
jgi:hypothetical protein